MALPTRFLLELSRSTFLNYLLRKRVGSPRSLCGEQQGTGPWGAPCPRPGVPKVGCGHPRGDPERGRCACARVIVTNSQRTSSVCGSAYGLVEGNVNVGNSHSQSRTCAQFGSGAKPKPIVLPRHSQLPLSRPHGYSSFDKPVW